MSEDLADLEEDEAAGVETGAGRLLHLRDGRVVRLRRVQPDDAHPFLVALNEVANEGRFLLRRAWDMTPALEQRWLEHALGGVDLLLLGVRLDSAETGAEREVAGSVSLVRGRPEFIRHTVELSLWLRPAYREQGLGSAMIEYALTWAAHQGDLEKICLSVRSTNRRALNLYLKYGFQEEGRRRAYIKTGQGYEDEVLLSRFVGARPGAPAAAPGEGGMEA